METQAKSKKIIRNQIYTIYGPPGAGKTFFATYLASFHRRIYANYEIKFRGKVVSNQINSTEDMAKLEYSDVKGVLVLDEMGVNANARRSSSDANMEFGHTAMLSRKTNVNVISISQLERMTDVYYRELSGVSFQLHSWFVASDKLMFEFEIIRNGKTQGSKFIDLMEWAQRTGYEYDTLESAKMDNGQKRLPLAEFNNAVGVL